MTAYRQQTVRAMRRLRFPEQLAEIEKRRYRHPDCLDAFLDVCEALITCQPEAGLVAAEQAPAYLQRVFPEGGGGSLSMRTFGVLGTAYVVAGQIAAAEDACERAAAFPASLEEVAVLACRVAHLRCEQQRWEEALAAANRAVRYAEQRYDANRPERETDRFSLAGALVTRANVHHQAYRFAAGSLKDAAADLEHALTVCSRKTVRTRLAAVHNLASVAAAAWIGGEAGILQPSQVIELMRRLRKSLHREKKIRHCSVVHAKTRWVMGLALAQEAVGLTRRAETYLRGAWDDLVILESYPDAAMLALDLGWWLLQDRQWPKLQALAVEIVAAPWARRLPTEWCAALELWRAGARARRFDDGVLEQVYGTVRGIRVEVPVLDAPPHRWQSPAGW